MRGIGIGLTASHHGRHGLRRNVHRLLPGRRQRIPGIAVDQQLHLFGDLVKALQHAHLQHIRQAQRPVTGNGAEFGRLDLAAPQRRHDLVHRQLEHRGAQLLIDLRRQPPGMKTHAGQVFGTRNGPLEPAEGRRGQRPVQQRMHLQPLSLVQLLQHGLAATVLVPRQQRHAVHPEGRATAPQPQGRLAHGIEAQHTMGRLQPAPRHGPGQRLGGHLTTGRQHLELQPAFGHRAQHLGQCGDVRMKIIFQRPGHLAAPDHRCRLGLRPGTGHGRAGPGR